jgi:hypothetical protein
MKVNCRMKLLLQYKVQGFANNQEFLLEKSQISIGKLVFKIKDDKNSMELPFSSLISVKIEKNEFMFGKINILQAHEQLAAYFNQLGIKYRQI